MAGFHFEKEQAAVDTGFQGLGLGWRQRSHGVQRKSIERLTFSGIDAHMKAFVSLQRLLGTMCAESSQILTSALSLTCHCNLMRCSFRCNTSSIDAMDACSACQTPQSITSMYLLVRSHMIVVACSFGVVLFELGTGEEPKREDHLR